MALRDELATQVATIFRSAWTMRDGQVVPEPERLQLGNDAIKFDRATVLYADMSASTALVDANSWQFAAEVYKAYLHCAAKLILSEGGAITSYDGDRVMGVFIKEFQCTRAVRCALKINYAVQDIINPALKYQYAGTGHLVRQVAGIDVSAIQAARTGVRGGNDIVWVGRAANYAAKLTGESDEYPTWITKAVFDLMADEAKFGGSPRQLMWKEWSWSKMNNIPVYSSNWKWTSL